MSEPLSEVAESWWVPDACTLPTQERPLRVMEFTELFSQALRGLTRPAADRLRLTFTPSTGVEARLRNLIVRESACCAFFDFTLGHGHDGLTLDIRVPAGHQTVLDALADHAAAAGRLGERG